MFSPSSPSCLAVLSQDGDGVLRWGIPRGRRNSRLRADSVARDDHTLNDRERVALEYRAVHECSGVALVAVADDIFCVVILIVCELPLASGGEASAAASAQTGLEDGVYDLLSVHGQCLCKTRISAPSERLVNIFGVDNAAAVQGNAVLLFIKVDVVLLRDLFLCYGVDIEQALDDARRR